MGKQTPPVAGEGSSASDRHLRGRVAVVAGATRGAGRGIARGLGEAGATVYCSGRSVEGQPSPYALPETIGQTADVVTAAGGEGIAVRTDHSVEADVERLFERVEGDHGRLDVLVNTIAGEDPMMAGWSSFWETDLANGPAVLTNALLSHVITAKYAAPLMIRDRHGLIVEVSESDMLFSSGNILAQMVKFAVKGLAVMFAEELRPHQVASVAVTPGYLRSESMLRHFEVTEENWRDGAKKDENFLASESPLYLGRGVAALAADGNVFARSGDVIGSWELARDYGIADYDGTRPDIGTHFATSVVPSTKWLREGIERHVDWLDRLARRAKAYLGGQ